MAGRWSLLPDRDLDPTRRGARARRGAAGPARRGDPRRGDGRAGDRRLRRPSTGARRVRGRGAARRGYFVEGLGAAQFAVPGAVDRLRGPGRAGRAGERTGASRWCWPRPTRPTRTARRCPGPTAWWTAATARPAPATGHRPGRKAGALVVLVDGELVLYVERGGRTLLTFTEDDPDALVAAGQALAALGAVRRARARCRSSAPTASRCTPHRCGTR